LGVGAHNGARHSGARAQFCRTSTDNNLGGRKVKLSIKHPIDARGPEEMGFPTNQELNAW